MKKYPQPCDHERRKELKRLLLLLAQRTTEDGTLTALGNKVNTLKYTVSRWICIGEVPPRVAGDLLRLPGANPSACDDDAQERIELKQLTPSLF